MPVPAAKKDPRRWRQPLIALSLANLCFLDVWNAGRTLLSGSLSYYRKQPSDPTLMLAMGCDILALAVLLWCAWAAAKRWGGGLILKGAQAGFLLLLAWLLYGFDELFASSGDPWMVGGGCLLLLLPGAVLIFGAVNLLLFDKRRILRFAANATIVAAALVPALALDFGCAWVSRSDPQTPAPRLAGPVALENSGRRIVWFVFDELDQDFVFEQRVPGVLLPNIDRLRNSSLYADRVAPAASFTLQALPSLILGLRLSRVETRGLSDLELWPEGRDGAVSWRKEPNVFDEMRALGFNTAMIGWFHPYCRILNNSLTECHSESSEHASDDLALESYCGSIGLFRSMAFLADWKIQDSLARLHLVHDSPPQSTLWDSVRARQAMEFLNIRAAALRSVTDPRLEFVMVHWPIPHPYGIFNRDTNRLSLRPGSSYLDNLALVDRTLGEVRAALERAGLWDRTTLLVTSDHPLRPDVWRGRVTWPPQMQRVFGHHSWRVPFLLKMPGEKQGLVYHGAFSALVAHDLLLAVARGQLQSAEDVRAWLDANGERGADAMAMKSYGGPQP